MTLKELLKTNCEIGEIQAEIRDADGYTVNAILLANGNDCFLEDSEIVTKLDVELVIKGEDSGKGARILLLRCEKVAGYNRRASR